MSMYLSIKKYQLSFPHSLNTAQVSLKARNGWRLCLHKEQIILGLGEVAPWSGFGAGLSSVDQEITTFIKDTEAQVSMLGHIESLLKDEALHKRLSELEDFAQRIQLLNEALLPILTYFKTPELQFGFEILTLDALARQLKLPLSMLLEPKTTLSANTHHLARNYQEALTLARKGYKALKIKVGVKDHWVEELMDIARIRATLPTIEIRVDANQAWTAELAFGFCVVAHAYNIAWVEEPCHSAQELLALEKKLNGLKTCSIGLDESLSQVAVPQEQLLSLSQVSHCTLKPMFIGGLLACAHQALSLFKQGKQICVTHALGSWIERTASAHLVSALRVHIPQLSAGLGGGLNHDICPPLKVFGGEIRLPNQAGLGEVKFASLDLDHDLNDSQQDYRLQAAPLNSSVAKQRHFTPANQLVPNPLRMATLARPNHIAVHDDDISMSYRELSQHALHLGQGLKKVINAKSFSSDKLSNTKKTLISLALPFSSDWLICFHAITAQAWCVAPLNPNLPQPEKLNSLSLVKADYHCQLGPNGLELYALDLDAVNNKVKLTLLDTLQIRSKFDPSKQDTRTDQIEDKLGLNQLQAWDWLQTLVVICTSGTTGQPQAIPLTVSQLYFSAFGSAIRLGHQLNDVWLACLPPHHVGGLSAVLRCLIYQTCIHIADAKATTIYESLTSCSLVSLTPSLLNGLVNEIQQRESKSNIIYQKPDTLRAILVGGGPTSEVLWEKAQQLSLPIRLTWGMSEAASQLCTQTELAPPTTPLPPLPFALIKHDQQKHLWISGPLVSTGHLKSNDLGEVSEQGVLIIGRADDTIISGGINISPQEIEDHLNAHPLIQASAVISQAHTKYGQRPVAFLVTQHDPPPSDDELKSWCRARLSAYKTPDEFKWCSHLPRNELGKLQRRKLKLSPELYVTLHS